MTSSQTFRECARQVENGAPSSPAAAPDVSGTNTLTLVGYLVSRPNDIAEFLKTLPPFLDADYVAQLEEYERKYNAYGEQMAASDGHKAEAEYERRRSLAADDPTPENLKVLAQESREELLKKFGERWAIFNDLRNQCIAKYATPLSKQLLPFLEKHAASFRAQIDSDFRTLHRHYGVPYDSADNAAVRKVDQWIYHQRRQLAVEDWARENRYPAMWEKSLPTPDYFRAACAGNCAAAPKAAPNTKTAVSLKPAAEAAAVRAA